MSEILASLIISAYKNTSYLSKVFESISLQTDKRFEIIVSQDAQCNGMKEFLSSVDIGHKILHLSQQDKGWRKNLALNRAIKEAKSDYLVFIDQDCLLHPRFMEFHIKYSRKKRVLAGKRVKLDPETTQLILDGTIGLENISSYIFQNIFRLKRQGLKFAEEAFFINPKSICGIIPRIRKMHQLKGCNMSFSRDAALAINGFDEDYTLPAIGEDIDLTWRFIKVGYRLKSLRNVAVQYHLYHKESWDNQDENIELMKEKQALKQFVCINGIIKYAK